MTKYCGKKLEWAVCVDFFWGFGETEEEALRDLMARMLKIGKEKENS